MANKIIGTKVAAEIVGVSQETMRRYAREKRLPCNKIVKDFRFRKRDVERFAEIR